MSLNRTIVPMPAPAPLYPLTDATDLPGYSSGGSTFAIFSRALVVKPATVDRRRGRRPAIHQRNEAIGLLAVTTRDDSPAIG
jgi:hypothetical protein